MNFDQTLHKFKDGEKYLNYCLIHLKPLILRTLKSCENDFKKIHDKCCINFTSKHFDRSTDGIYDFFDDLSLIDQYIACGLMTHFCSILLDSSNGIYREFDEIEDDSVIIGDKFKDENILTYSYMYFSNGELITEKHIDFYNDLCEKNNVKRYREWEK